MAHKNRKPMNNVMCHHACNKLAREVCGKLRICGERKVKYMETTYDGLMETLFQETKQAEDKLQQLMNHGLHGSVLMETTKAGYDSLYHSLEKAGIDGIYEKWKESGALDRTIWKADADNNMDEAGHESVSELLGSPSMDSLGMGSIVYFPNIEVEEEDEEEEEEDEDEDEDEEEEV